MCDLLYDGMERMYMYVYVYVCLNDGNAGGKHRCLALVKLVLLGWEQPQYGILFFFPPTLLRGRRCLRWSRIIRYVHQELGRLLLIMEVEVGEIR